MLTQSDLSAISAAGLLERMEWHVPQVNGLALKSLKLRLNSRLFLYNYSSFNEGESVINLEEVYAVKGK